MAEAVRLGSCRVCCAAFVVFHQPILLALIRFGATRFAAGQHLSLQYDVEGRVLSGLVFSNVRILPSGESPVEKITIEQIRVTYSLIDLLRHGRGGFLKSLDVKNASLVFKDVDDPSSLKPGRSHLGSDMHSWFFPPATLIGKADVENLNIVNHLQVGDFALLSGEIHFERGRPGSLKIARMQIPGLRVWNNIEGRVTVTENDVTIENLMISPDVIIEKWFPPQRRPWESFPAYVAGSRFRGRFSGN